MKPLRTVTYELPVRLVVSHDLVLPLHMEVRYKPDDPYAVSATFYPVGQGRTVEWVFSRDMLAQALSRHVGQGDVRMWPAGGAERRVLRIALRPPEGSALLEVPAHEVEVFLRNAYSVVPPGSESKQLDLDTELALLLSDR
jgi:hypothetical protein